jgi:hypothetical protein
VLRGIERFLTGPIRLGPFDRAPPFKAGAMSGRSGYRKTGRKRNRHAPPQPRSEYVLRFVLPEVLAFALSPGEHGFGVSVGFNDVAFVSGQSPSHCCSLTSAFLDKIGARSWPQRIKAAVIKLLPCSVHCFPSRGPGFKPLTNDVEAIHDNISRNTVTRRPCSIEIGEQQIRFRGATAKPIAFDYAEC